MITVRRGVSTYDGVNIYDRDVLKAVGMETYQWLRHNGPQLWHDFKTQVKLEQQWRPHHIIALDYKLTPHQLKTKLITALGGGVTSEVARRLITRREFHECDLNRCIVQCTWIMIVFVFAVIIMVIIGLAVLYPQHFPITRTYVW